MDTFLQLIRVMIIQLRAASWCLDGEMMMFRLMIHPPQQQPFFMCFGLVSIFFSNMFSSFTNISILCFSRFLNFSTRTPCKKRKTAERVLKLFTQNVPIDFSINFNFYPSNNNEEDVDKHQRIHVLKGFHRFSLF